jgi:hypothetical protein
VSGRRFRTEEVLLFLGIRERSFLEQLREVGLFESDDLAPDDAEELRLARILMDEMGVNAAGVDVALHLRRRLLALETRARALLDARDANASRR